MQKLYEQLPAGLQIFLAGALTTKQLSNLATDGSVSSFFGKAPWIFLGVDMALGAIQNRRNGDSWTRTGSNAAARFSVGAMSIVGGGLFGAIGIPIKGSLPGALIGGIISGSSYVVSSLSGFIGRVGDRIYEAARGWQVIANYAWENLP